MTFCQKHQSFLSFEHKTKAVQILMNDQNIEAKIGASRRFKKEQKKYQ